MILTLEQTIRSVRTILEEQVLPSLSTADWTASNIRASLLLLTYAEDSVRLERPLLIESEAAILSLFRSALARDDLPWLTGELRDSVREAIADAPRDAPTVLATLAARHVAQKTALSDESFREELHACLAFLQGKDAELTARARVMLPI
ncbi:MAG: hypothetical protein QHC40_01090 [Sphingobium sp.]|nr:hypothetical protein [Sphingobium sp.]